MLLIQSNRIQIFNLIVKSEDITEVEESKSIFDVFQEHVRTV